MRKIVPWAATFMVIAVAGFMAPAASFADTATTTSSSSIQTQLNLIASLEQQIQALQQQIQALRQQQQSATASLVQSLSVGSTGNQVKVLQAMLAADPSIYPEGLITGYFGPLTEKAVKRFQEKNGIVSSGTPATTGYGRVGPKTRDKLNEDLQNNPVAFENGTSTATTTSGESEGEQNGQGHAYGHVCAIVPPGHLIAPGWLRKNGGEEPIVPECQTLPPGIEDHLNATSTPTSTVTLAVSNVSASVATSTATVDWTTNLSADSQVNYGLTSAYGSSTALDSALVTSHSEMISGLTPDTVYHFQVVSANASGTATSSDMTFTTNALESLAISGIGVNAGTSTVNVTWSTNRSADSEVLYGATTSYGSSTSDSALVTSHSLDLTGLSPSATYHFEVVSTNASGTATSSDQTFSTNALPDTTPPVISSITFSAASTTASVSWTTNEDATGKVYYGTVSPLDLAATSTAAVSTTTLSMSHSFDLSGLTASTTYYYVVESADSSGNVATSSEQSFVTTN